MGNRIRAWLGRYRPENWAAIQARGKRRFVLTEGLVFALWMFFVLTFLEAGVNHIPLRQVLFTALMVCPTTGLVYAWWMWWLLQRRHRQQR